jgi:hypothetical protein
MFQRRGAIIRGRSVQRNVDPTHQSSYHVALTGVIKILNIKILTYIKLKTINLQCYNINNIKHMHSRYCSCLQLYGSCIQTAMSMARRDLVLVERMQRGVVRQPTAGVFKTLSASSYYTALSVDLFQV